MQRRLQRLGRSGNALYQAVGIWSCGGRIGSPIPSFGSAVYDRRSRHEHGARGVVGARTRASPTSTASNPAAAIRAASSGVRIALSATAIVVGREAAGEVGDDVEMLVEGRRGRGR